MMPPPKKSKMPLLIVIFAVLAVVFMGISLVQPWYSIKSEIGGTTSEGTMGFNGVSNATGGTTSWGDIKTMDKTKGVYSMTQIMVILGLVMSILLLIGGIMLMKGPGKKMLALIFGLLAFIFCMLGPILFMAQHQGAYKDDSGGVDPGYGPANSFSGTKEQTIPGGGIIPDMTVKMTWGPAMGWIMGLMGFIFALLGFILVLMVKKEAAPAPPAPMPTPPPPPQ